jgi:tRNA-2-methylthio-N6-dimethylallyladenosine synthase
MYKYSERPGTPAAKKLSDDIPEEVKGRRLQEIIALQNDISKQKNQAFIGKVVEVLVEADSKRSAVEWMGRNDQNVVVVFPKEGYKKGDLVKVLVESASTTTLRGKAIAPASW